jgi:hypothetical protein
MLGLLVARLAESPAARRRVSLLPALAWARHWRLNSVNDCDQ